MKKRILVVDDSEAILEVVKMILVMADCEVSTSLTGACFQHMEHNLPDLILLDVLLSGEDGGEICQRLKSDDQTRHIPVILLTARAYIAPETEFSGLGATGVIAKPFDALNLASQVAQTIGWAS